MELCIVCDKKVRPRGYRRITDLDNLPPGFQENARLRRRNNDLQQSNIAIGTVIHITAFDK